MKNFNTKFDRLIKPNLSKFKKDLKESLQSKVLEKWDKFDSLFEKDDLRKNIFKKLYQHCVDLAVHASLLQEHCHLIDLEIEKCTKNKVHAAYLENFIKFCLRSFESEFIELIQDLMFSILEAANIKSNSDYIPFSALVFEDTPENRKKNKKTKENYEFFFKILNENDKSLLRSQSQKRNSRHRNYVDIQNNYDVQKYNFKKYDFQDFVSLLDVIDKIISNDEVRSIKHIKDHVN